MRTFTLRIIILISGWVLTACGGVQMEANSVASGESKVASSTNPIGISKIEFYKGGFYAGPDSLNWSHDLTIKVREDGSADLQAETGDSFCSKSAFIPAEDMSQVTDLIYAMTFKGSEGPVVSDMGVETLKVTYSNGDFLEVHLLDGSLEAGQLVATNGEALSQALKNLDDMAAMVCE